MRLKFIQYTSPQSRPGGYQWLETAGYENILDKFENYLRNINWSEFSENYRGGICLFPGNGIGIVFRRIQGLLSFDKRNKTTTNGAVFLLQEAAQEGLNGIWDLPFLNDPSEENNAKEICFSPLQEPYNNPFGVFKRISDYRDDIAFVIFKESDGAWGIKKICFKKQEQQGDFLENIKFSALAGNLWGPQIEKTITEWLKILKNLLNEKKTVIYSVIFLSGFLLGMFSGCIGAQRDNETYLRSRNKTTSNSKNIKLQNNKR